MKKPTKKKPELTNKNIYNKLREAHSFVKELILHPGFEELDDYNQMAIGTVSNVMYLSEKQFAEF